MPTKIEYRRETLSSLNFENFNALKYNWEYTYRELSRYNDIFNKALDRDDIAIVVAGSYGRREASESSDIDFTILIRDELPERDKSELLSQIRSIIKGAGVEFPNSEGVFSSIVSVKEAINNTGHFDDSLKFLAQRILLIMESKPVYNEKLLEEAISMILDKYLEFVIKEPRKEAIFLMNDVIRYFRAICVNYQFNFWKQHEKWTIRIVKLWHSRVIMYAGTLFLLINASKHINNKYEYIREKMNWTPLERIAHVYEDNDDNGIEKVLLGYEIFLRKISDYEIRNSLKLDYEDRFQSPHYVELKASAALIRTELTRFILSRKNNWSGEILEYLIF